MKKVLDDVNDSNLKDIESRIISYARMHPQMDDDGNLDFEETAYIAATWAMYNLPFKTIYGDVIGSADDWYGFIVDRCVNLRETLEEDLLNG